VKVVGRNPASFPISAGATAMVGIDPASDASPDEDFWLAPNLLQRFAALYAQADS